MALKLIDEDFIDNKISDYEHMRDGWKPQTPNYECYDLVVREYEKLKSKLQPLPESYSKEEVVKLFVDLRSDVELFRQKFSRDANKQPFQEFARMINDKIDAIQKPYPGNSKTIAP